MRGGNNIFGMCEPPKGVLSGDSVPVENQSHEIKESKIRRIANTLKGYEPYSSWSDEERRTKARELIQGER